MKREKQALTLEAPLQTNVGNFIFINNFNYCVYWQFNDSIVPALFNSQSTAHIFSQFSVLRTSPLKKTFIFISMKMTGMFKCLSVTEGNVALGPEVQFSVSELDTTFEWQVLSKLEWSNVIKRNNELIHTINNSRKSGIVRILTWTYNFGTLNERCIRIVNPLWVLEEKKMTS